MKLKLIKKRLKQIIAERIFKMKTFAAISIDHGLIESTISKIVKNKTKLSFTYIKTHLYQIFAKDKRLDITERRV